MAKAMGPFRDSQSPSWLSGPRTDKPTELLLSHRPRPCFLVPMYMGMRILLLLLLLLFSIVPMQAKDIIQIQEAYIQYYMGCTIHIYKMQDRLKSTKKSLV